MLPENRDYGSHFALLLQCVLRLETLDDIENTAPSHKFGDGGANSLRLATATLSVRFFVFIVIPFAVEISNYSHKARAGW